MPLLQSLRYRLSKFFGERPTDPAVAYDQWSASYDSQPDNLMLALDEQVFSDLLAEIDINNMVIADIGCGTGRHWKKIMDQAPSKLIGYDVSAGMLQMLQRKFPEGVTQLLVNDELKGLADNSCDVVISTLTIAHIRNVSAAMKEWCRVLKPGGEMIITDYHPAALSKGAKRTFNTGAKTVAIINHVYPVETIRSIAKQLQLREMRFLEKQIDDTMRPFYEKQHALQIFEAWQGVPIIYGIRFKKTA